MRPTMRDLPGGDEVVAPFPGPACCVLLLNTAEIPFWRIDPLRDLLLVTLFVAEFIRNGFVEPRPHDHFVRLQLFPLPHSSIRARA
jgi:hypothetical protein